MLNILFTIHTDALCRFLKTNVIEYRHFLDKDAWQPASSWFYRMDVLCMDYRSVSLSLSPCLSISPAPPALPWEGGGRQCE